MLKGQNVSITICLTFCCRLLLSGSWFAVSPIQWFPETKEVPITFFIWALPTQQMLTVSVGALATSLGLAISGQSDKLRTHCCKVIVVWGQCGTSFPSVMLRGGEQLMDVVPFYNSYFFPSFSRFCSEYFWSWVKRSFLSSFPSFAPRTHLYHSLAPPFSTSCLISLWFTCCFSCSHIHALLSLSSSTAFSLPHMHQQANEDNLLLSIAMGVTKLASYMTRLLCLNTFWMEGKFY